MTNFFVVGDRVITATRKRGTVTASGPRGVLVRWEDGTRMTFPASDAGNHLWLDVPGLKLPEVGDANPS